MKYLGQQSQAIQTLSDSQNRKLHIDTPMMEGPDVKQVQEKLGVTADGMYGPVTEQAVKNFQQERGLTVDGVVGPNTWTALQSSSSKDDTSLAVISSPLQTITGLKGQYWDPLSTTEKAMYGGGALALLLGVGIAMNKR